MSALEVLIGRLETAYLSTDSVDDKRYVSGEGRSLSGLCTLPENAANEYDWLRRRSAVPQRHSYQRSVLQLLQAAIVVFVLYTVRRHIPLRPQVTHR